MIEDKAYEAALDLLKQKDLIIAKMGRALRMAEEWSAKYPLQGQPSEADKATAELVYEAVTSAQTSDIEALVKEDEEREARITALTEDVHRLEKSHAELKPVVVDLLKAKQENADLRKSLEEEVSKHSKTAKSVLDLVGEISTLRTQNKELTERLSKYEN